MPVSLHTHSWYSLLEATSSPAALLKRAAHCGYRTLALTDTNNLYGAMNFVLEAEHHGIRPLLGACLRRDQTRAVALMADRSGYPSLWDSDPAASEYKASRRLLTTSSQGLHLLVDNLDLAAACATPFRAGSGSRSSGPPIIRDGSSTFWKAHQARCR